ncbi:hypothetical protein ABZ901_10750 [Actinacidiphila alni]|uniref:hypothetical protein n=1 Tax=Actinacidiphila alni TaxID=380248 RepID=UPI00340244BC
MIVFALTLGGVIAYFLFQWIGVAYYLLVVDWIVVSAFAWLVVQGAAVSVRYVREGLIPARRLHRLVRTYNQQAGREPISSLNVHLARVSGYGTDGATTAAFDGIALDDVLLLRSRSFYMITTRASIELWERRNAEFHEVAWFDKEVVDSTVLPRSGDHTLEVRFPEGTVLRLDYAAA